MVKEADAVLDALREIAKRNKGLVRPVLVVEAARDKASPLHGRFEWSNKKAADEFRLWQARELIAQYWVVEPMSNEPIRMMLSLTSDRPTKAGYRFSEHVLADPDQRAEWLQMALGDLQRWKRSYGALVELKPVIMAINRLATKYEVEDERAAG
ncbi:MAG: hypothetical protein M3P06_11385 [Acidobacteriota bacterium]|nr:hypothetical protein [Acidobacteriota bacterium]